MVPDSRLTSVGVEYFCDEGDDLWPMNDDDMVEMAMDDLVKLGFAQHNELVESVVHRQGKAYPIYTRDYKEHVCTIRRYLESMKNLQTIGRSGMHRYNNIDHAMLTGILAAKNILGQEHDLWTVNEEDSYLEEKSQVSNKNNQSDQKCLQKAFARIKKSP